MNELTQIPQCLPRSIGTPRRVLSALGVLMGMSMLAACGSLPRAPTALQLELVSSQTLALAADCQAQGTFRAEFMVLADGQVTAVDTASAPTCVREGLSAWVQTFRYAPTGTNSPVPHAVELVLVNAPRG